jgi:hypothetical protein
LKTAGGENGIWTEDDLKKAGQSFKEAFYRKHNETEFDINSVSAWPSDRHPTDLFITVTVAESHQHPTLAKIRYAIESRWR